jgi:hypothetical protein
MNVLLSIDFLMHCVPFLMSGIPGVTNYGSAHFSGNSDLIARNASIADCVKEV